MIRKLSALFAGMLLCAIASSQSVPNGGTITNGQVWTTPQWINAWQSKFDVTGGSLTAPTITNPAISGGTQSAPTIASPAITGSATLNGSLALTGSSTLTRGGSTIPAVNQSPTWTGNHTFAAASGLPVSVSGVPGAQLQWGVSGHTGELYATTAGVQIGSFTNDSLGLFVNNGGPALNFDNTGAATFNAPASPSLKTLVVNGNATGYGIYQVGDAVAFGIANSTPTTVLVMGTNKAVIGGSDVTNGALYTVGTLSVYSNNTTTPKITVNNGLQIGSPTGGDQGAGTINMQGCFVNGASCGGGGAAAAGSLTGTTLASNVVSSSLTSLGAVTSGSFPAANISGTTLAGGVTASSLTSVGTLSSLAVSGNITMGGVSVGYLNIPPNQQSGPYTAVLSDSGKMVESVTASPITFTIPSNASVPYPIGTVITFTSVPGSGTVTIAIAGTDTLTLAGTASTGSRSLAQSSVATAIKVTATQWNISGAGLT